MNVKELINKLAHPNWFPQNPYTVITNSEGRIGYLNLAWVLNGRPEKINQDFFDKNWFLAIKICDTVIDGATVSDWIMLYTEEEFYRFVEDHVDIFSEFMPLDKWKQLLKEPHDL